MADSTSAKIPLLCVAILAFSITARSAEAGNSVSYIGSPPPPVNGILLPDAPSDLDRVVFRTSLGFTFSNSCYASAANGPSTIIVDSANRTISVAFDESSATLFPFCSGEFAPVNAMQVEIDPLPAGRWTLQVDEMLSIFRPVPAQSIEFDVQSSISEVPTGGRAYLTTSALIMMATSILLQQRRRSAPRLEH